MTLPATSLNELITYIPTGGAVAAAPEAPTKPAEAPVDVPTRQDPNPREPDKSDDPDIDEQIKRIIREIPDPTPQPGGE
jgi:hypothetical protein